MFIFAKRDKEKVKESRPWGDFEVLSKENNVTIKRITVLPEKRLSYQSHNKRTEHWYITQGTGTVIINNAEFKAVAGQSFDIPVQAKHRIGNTDTKNNLVFIEISTGDFAEDDIVRYEDDFGRTNL